MRLPTLLCAIVFTLPFFNLARADDPPPLYRLQVHCVQGHNTMGLINAAQNEFFRTPIERLFGLHKVHYYREGPTRNELLNIIRQSDIFYTNSHAGNAGGRHFLEVKPSPDNYNVSAVEKRSYTHSGEIHGIQTNPELGPRLVIINGCSMMNYQDGVNLSNRLVAAFGINDQSEGRAFIGWGDKIVGNKGDNYFREFLLEWGEPRDSGPYPTLEETARSRARRTQGINDNSLAIVGDKDLRFDYLAGYAGQNNVLGRWHIVKLEEKRGNQVKQVDLGMFQGVIFDLRRGGSAELLTTAGQRPPNASAEAMRWRLDNEQGNTVLKIGFQLRPTMPRQWYTLQLEFASRNSGSITYSTSDALQIYTMIRK